MENIYELINWIVFIIFGICSLFISNQFISRIKEYKFVKINRSHEIIIKALFYLIGVVFIVGGLIRIIKTLWK